MFVRLKSAWARWRMNRLARKFGVDKNMLDHTDPLVTLEAVRAQVAQRFSRLCWRTRSLVVQVVTEEDRLDSMRRDLATLAQDIPNRRAMEKLDALLFDILYDALSRGLDDEQAILRDEAYDLDAAFRRIDQLYHGFKKAA